MPEPRGGFLEIEQGWEPPTTSGAPTAPESTSLIQRLRRARFLPSWLRPAGSQDFHLLATDENGSYPGFSGAPSFSDGNPDGSGSGGNGNGGRHGGNGSTFDENKNNDGENNRPSGRWCPEEDASITSQLLFSWVGSLLTLGMSKNLNQEDLWDVARSDSASMVSGTFQAHLAATSDEFTAPQGRVGMAMWRTHGRLFIIAGIIKFFHDGIMFLGPYILEVLLNHLGAGGSGWIGLGLAAALAGAAMLETLTVNAYFHVLFRICLHLKTALVDMLYHKSLRVSAGARSDTGVGAIVNLQSNDAAKLWNMPQYLHMVWSGPLQILAVMAMLVRVIHPLPALVGLGVTVALIPMSALVARALARVRKRVVALTDARVKLCGEVVTGIKAIKLYAWEGPYKDRIMALREQELREIRLAALIGTWNNMLWIGGPILISMAAFLMYSSLGYPLTASVAFPALSLFNLLRFPVMMLPTQILNLVNSKVALDRIQKFMESEEMHQAPALPVGAPAVSVRGGAFSWGPGKEVLLHDIDFSVAQGQLVIVVGSVGAGKTSLLGALLGELTARRGSVQVRGAVAYTQQEPWIQNASLKDNILLGAEMDQQRYNAVLSSCALLPDLSMLPAGDETEIGEKGVNLSGGQRHRVALARACYAAADVYLLDDPLSAVDAHVGRHLFDQCLLGLLRSTTRVLVTHQLQYLPAADVVVIVRDGRIVDRGSYDELVARGVDFHQFELHNSSEDNAEVAGAEDGSEAAGNIELAGAAAGENGVGGGLLGVNGHGGSSLDGEGERELEEVPLINSNSAEEASDAMFKNCMAAETGLIEPASTTAAAAPGTPPKVGALLSTTTKPLSPTRQRKDSHRLTKAEERAVGRVDRRVYLRYFSAWGPALLIPSAVLALSLTERGLQSGQNWWLSVWSEGTAAVETASEAAGTDPTEALATSTKYYMNVYFALGLVSLGFQVIKAVTLVLGSISAARALQASLLATVLRLPMSFFDSQPTGRLLNRFTKDTEAVDTSLQASVSSFLNCAVSVVWSLVVVVAVSPAVALTFLPLTFAYSYVQRRYIATSRELKRLDSLALSPIFSHFSETLHGLATLRAFRVQPRFEARNAALLDESNRCFWPAQCVNRWLSVRLELLGIGVVFGTAMFVSSALPTSAGLAGLALTSALNLTGLLNWMVRQTTELEVNMNAVERLVEYDTEKKEAPEIIEEHRPLPEWPARGAISVENLVVRYRPELDPVLKGISFGVRPGEKIGVAGRTGCGKSTLMLALYRIVEPSSGRIVIDAVDVSTIGLRDLRSRLALVPQDPVVFSGTVRSNLDPFGLADGDAALWSALERAGLAPTVRAYDGGLDASVSEGGGNLSAGQRQLLCMARALLRSARILILDEATSSIDTATDAVIQGTIATAFAECTVLTIAHRLHTIIASDRVLVLDAGKVLEYDTPSALLQRRGGAFRALVDETSAGMKGQGGGGGKSRPDGDVIIEEVLGDAM